MTTNTIKMQRSTFAFRIISYLAVSIFAFICVFPFYIVFISSFTSESSVLKYGFGLFIKEFSIEAYALSLKNPMTIVNAYLVTILVTVLGTCLSLFLATLTGYVLQRQDFKYRNHFSFFFFFTTLFNGGLTPWYILCTKYLHFKNNIIALILPLSFSVWYTIIAKNYFKSIPYSITESAKIDGAKDFMIYYKIMLPLAKPLLATIGLFAALMFWNDWYNCLLFITDDKKQNLQYFLQRMLNSLQAMKLLASKGGTVSDTGIMPQETMKMAMTVIATGPIVAVYPFVQKYFVKGLTIGAVKG